MSYQPRSTNPYIMEKKLNNCVGGGGFNPSVLEEIEAEISVLGSENATMAQDIIDIKGSLNSLNDNLTNLDDYVKANNKGTQIYLTVSYSESNPFICPNDGYISVYKAQTKIFGATETTLTDDNKIAAAYANTSTDAVYSVFVKKGMKIVVYSLTNAGSITFTSIQ